MSFFEKILRFFIKNSRFNYTLFVLIYIIGIISYIKLPKEIFPIFDLDMIVVSGHYNGASVDTLNKMVVNELEEDLKTIDGLHQITSVIKPGSFSIILELNKGVDKTYVKDRAKDIVSQNQSNLPDDMDEPTVKTLQLKKDLLEISIYSDTLGYKELLKKANELKAKIYNIKNINEVIIYGDRDERFEIVLDEKKIIALNLNPNEVYKVLSGVSFVFPIGELKSKKKFFLSTINGPKSIKEFNDIILNIGSKQVYLKDIATIKKSLEEAKTLFSLDGKKAVNLVVSQAENGSAIKIQKQIKSLIDSLENKNVHYIIRNDLSVVIKDRLNIVVSNILVGLILITLIVSILINFRVATIIFIGIPTSFVIGAVYFYFMGFTINLISLVGVLLAIGILVDDAMVVSENIQQYIEKGLNPTEAAIKGTLEMVGPVTIASLTTIFAFLPTLMMSGTMGEVIKLIPIALSVLIIASLIESFIFLPIHAIHTLKSEAKVLSWERANQIYSKIIHYLLHYKKTFLTIFMILVPIFSVIAIKKSHFKMFPVFDTTIINISLKANKNSSIEQTLNIANGIAKELLKQKQRFYIKDIGVVAGKRKDGGGNSESLPYSAFITIELNKLKPLNFVDKYITPYLSFYYDKKGRTREKPSWEIAQDLRDFLKEKGFKKKYNLVDLLVLERKVGPIKADVKIGLVSKDLQKLSFYIDLLTKKLYSINGTKNVANSLEFGRDELKIKINRYGLELGVDEAYIGSFLVNKYLEKKVASSFMQNSIFDIDIVSKFKDNFKEFINQEIPLKDGRLVRLNQICEIKVKKSFEKLTKDRGEVNFYVFANVNPKIITASEVLDKLEPILNEAKKNGIKIVLKGEAEKNKELVRDMKFATIVAMLLILLSLLYLFNSFRQTFIVMLVIPYSILGVLVGHLIMGVNLGMTSVIGTLGLAGIVINDGIIMMSYLRKEKTLEGVYKSAARRLRPIILTSVTTLVGMSTLIFFPTGQAVIFQPMAIALGFGLLWGTILNLLFVPTLYSVVYKIK